MTKGTQGPGGGSMKPFRWSSDKNIEARYPGQRILVVLICGYAHLVPYVEADDHLFLKTIIPSRKATIAYRPRDRP